MKIKLKNVFFRFGRKRLLQLMKAFIFLWCTAIFSFTTTNSFSQNAKISIKADTIVSVDMVFDIIMEQTDYSFIYSKGFFDAYPKVILHKGVIKANTLLNKTLKNSDVSYKFLPNKTIVIVKKTGNSSVNQQLQIRGKVLDENTLPLLGVTIVVEGTTNGVTTDYKGNYVINAKQGDVLSFSYIGYLTQKIKIEDNTSILNVILKENVNVLDEVTLISTGYQRLSQAKNTGSVKSVSSETIERKGNSDILQSLEGQVAGLGMVFDPNNEGQVKFDIRGVTSLNGNSSPLIIVDGFPLEGSISSINPYEIKSVNVLKDAAASSIYGARAANGVIVITTKKGRKGSLKINYRTSYTVKEKSDLSYRLNRVNSSNLVDIQEEYALSRRDSDPTTFHTYEYLYNTYPDWRGYYSPASNLVFDAYTQLNDGNITQSELDFKLKRLRGVDNTKQFSKYFLQNEAEKQHSLSFSGGGDRGSYRASLNATTTEGNWKGSKSDRIIFGLINNYEVNEKIDMDFSTNVFWNNNKSIPIDESVVFGSVNSYESIVDKNGNYLPVSAGVIDGLGSKDPFAIDKLVEAGLLNETYYPLQELEERSNTRKDLSVRVQARINAKITADLTGNFGFQYETGSINEEYYTSGESFEMKQLINNTTPLSFTGDLSELNIPYGGRIVETKINKNSYTLRGQLDFNKTFSNHEISAIAGSEIRNVFNKTTVNDKFGYDPKTLLFKQVDKEKLRRYVTDVYYYNGNAIRVPFLDDFDESTNRFFSLYGNTTYGYKSKYILAGSIRMDQSNLFGTDPEYRYKPFWSGSGKWRIAEENFFNVKGINKLDFRMSYGINGNISNQYGPFDIATYGVSNYTGATSLSLSTPAIANLRWERTETTNYGVDTDLFNSKLSISLDYYIKNTSDLISNAKADGTLGFNRLVKNTANMENKGVELSLNSNNIVTPNFSWNTFLTIRHNKNIVTKSYNQNEEAYYAVGVNNYEGAAANSFFVFDWNGLNDEGEATIKTKEGDVVVIEPGFDRFADVSFKDIVNAGSFEPKYTGALTNNFTYKDFGLSFMFVGSGGHVLLKDTYNGEWLLQAPSSPNSDVSKAWKIPGDELTTDVPKVNSYNYTDRISMWSTKNIVEADYIKLREVIFTYSLPTKTLKESKIDNITFNFKANNLFYWAKNKEGIDPESHGIGTRYFPTRAAYTMGVNITF